MSCTQRYRCRPTGYRWTCHSILRTEGSTLDPDGHQFSKDPDLNSHQVRLPRPQHYSSLTSEDNDVPTDTDPRGHRGFKVRDSRDPNYIFGSRSGSLSFHPCLVPSGFVLWVLTTPPETSLPNPHLPSFSLPGVDEKVSEKTPPTPNVPSSPDSQVYIKPPVTSDLHRPPRLPRKRSSDPICVRGRSSVTSSTSTGTLFE